MIKLYLLKIVNYPALFQGIGDQMLHNKQVRSGKLPSAHSALNKWSIAAWYFFLSNNTDTHRYYHQLGPNLHRFVASPALSAVSICWNPKCVYHGWWISLNCPASKPMRLVPAMAQLMTISKEQEKTTY